MLLVRDCRPVLGRFENNMGEVPREAPGLSQSEITGNKEHHNNNTDDVKNIAHVSFSFLSRDLDQRQAGRPQHYK